MHDQIDARLWADHGHAFASSVAQLVDELRFGFRRLNAIEFAAPWRRGATRHGR